MTFKQRDLIWFDLYFKLTLLKLTLLCFILLYTTLHNYTKPYFIIYRLSTGAAREAKREKERTNIKTESDAADLTVPKQEKVKQEETSSEQKMGDVLVKTEPEPAVKTEGEG